MKAAVVRKAYRRALVLQAMRDWNALFPGLNPSVRDLCAATGITSTSQVHEALEELRTEGKIRWYAQKSRSVSLVEGA